MLRSKIQQFLKISPYIILSILLFFSQVFANNPNLIPAEKAFSVSFENHNNQFVIIKWKILHGYQLYKDKISVQESSGQTVKMGKIVFPQGIIQKDAVLGEHEVYTQDFSLQWPILAWGNGQLKIKLNYQGCKENTFCYPPIQQNLVLDLKKLSMSKASGNQFTQILQQKHLMLVMLVFFAMGILLAFTPCVLPMIPLLSSLIVGQHNQLTTRQTFFLTSVYVLSMALAYAAAGVFAGYAGDSLQAKLQHPIVIGIFSLVFALLALSLFGFYELQLPAWIRNHLHSVNAKQKSGTYLGVALMGALSMLIVSPCVSAPLVGTLSYISRAGSPLLGGIALFMLGLGMGLPLLLVGVLEGKYLPKSGAWMLQVKHFFGVMMLVMAIWLLARIIPVAYTLILSGCLVVGISVFFYYLHNEKIFLKILSKTVALTFLLYGGSLIVGGLMGNGSFVHPLSVTQSMSISKKNSLIEVTTLAQLQYQLQQAKQVKKPVLIDYYADWCLLCKEIDHTIFNQRQVVEALSSFVVIRANVTDNDFETKKMQKKYAVFSPPSLRFFNRDGEFLEEKNVDGSINMKQLLKKLESI